MSFSILSGNLILNLGILFFAVFICSLGIPGGFVWLVSSGALSSNLFELIIVMTTGAAAAILGDFSAYFIAKKFSVRLLPKLRKWRLFKDKEEAIKGKFIVSDFSIIFFSRFLFTEICAIVSYISGLEQIKKRKFLIAVIPGEIIYAIFYPIIGFFFKETWNDITILITNITTILLIIIIMIIIIVRYKITHQKK